MSTKNAVIVELFTSQGCSSCPPADRLLSSLGKERRDGTVIVPLAFHVDYWNSIGWADPFSSAKWSVRQSAYASAMRSSQVYTPQMIVNGRAQFVGSDERRIRDEIVRQANAPAAGSVVIRRLSRDGAAVRVDLDASLSRTAGGEADVYVVIYESGITTAVQRGENSGRRLTNDFIVRSLDKAFSVRAGENVKSHSVTLPLAAAWRPGRLGVAAFIQDRKSLSIYGGAVQAMLE